MPKAKITLASIYEILQDHTARFEAVDGRFETMHSRFETMHSRFDAMDSRFDSMNTRFDTMEQRLVSVEGLQATIDTRIGSVEGLQSTMAARLVSIEERLVDHSTILMPLRDRVEALFGLTENLDARTGRLRQEYTKITAALRRLEEKFDSSEAEQLRKRIDALENRVSALESP